MPRLAFLLALPLLLAVSCTRGPSRPPPASGKSADVAPPPPAPVGPPAEQLLEEAQALRAVGELGAARERLEEALERAPAGDAIRLELAELLVADGRDLERAAAVLDGVAEQDGSARFLRTRGQLAELEGDDEGAAAAYARALAAAPDPELRLRRALVLERLGRHPEALAELEQARSSQPDDPVTRARLAGAYEATGRLREAEAELLAAAEAAPDRAAGWDRLAAFYRRTGRREAARAAEARAKAAAGAPPERALRPLPRSPR